MRYAVKFEKDLRRNPYKGLYICIEGIDGSGKSTQISNIKNHFENEGKKVVITSEPMAEGPIQKLIRDALFSKVKIPSRAYQSLYSADRAVNHATIVEPALRRGDIVLTHRSNWTTIPYGILDLESEYSFNHKAWPLSVANGLFSYYHEFIMPDATFYLKISARKAMERLKGMSKEKDAYEKGEKLAKIVYGYDTEVAKFSGEITIIDGEQEEQVVTNQILAKIQKML